MSKKLEDMTHEERVEHLSTATRVTVGTVSHVVQDDEGKNIIKTSYVAKIRGRIIGGPDNWKFATREEAREYGWRVLDKWRADWRAKQEVENE